MGYGFPVRCYAGLLGKGEDHERTIIADFTATDFPSPGLLPVMIEAKGGLAQKVRITATRLTDQSHHRPSRAGDVFKGQHGSTK